MPGLKTLFNYCRKHERNSEDLELIYEKLLQVPALSHLSTSIKRELAAVLLFQSYPKSGTICKYLSSSLGNKIQNFSVFQRE